MFSLWNILILIIFIFFMRLTYVLRSIRSRSHLNHQRKSSKTMIVMGSGGHTAEMMRIMKYLNKNIFMPRIYIVATSDSKTLSKITETDHDFSYCIEKIPRSRKVQQNYFLSIFTTLNSILYSIPIVLLHNPDVILCNGPGTCVPICLSAFLMKLLFLSNNCIIFIESICRVKTLSLSGKILYSFADQILVQWPELCVKYPRSVFLGDLRL